MRDVVSFELPIRHAFMYYMSNSVPNERETSNMTQLTSNKRYMFKIRTKIVQNAIHFDRQIMQNATKKGWAA
jgi:hypothetical protein